MDLTHWMNVDDGGNGQLVLSCPEAGCGRRVLISRSNEITVLDTGDFFSRHIAATGPVVLDAEISA